MGTQETPIITLGEEAKKIETLLEVFIDEFRTRDNIQGEMLQMMLKRLIIKITRLAKEQLVTKELKESQIDIIRKFNVLVDLHFREKRQVNEYAEMLFKSPKTLSNLFAKYNHKSPLQIIQERIVLETKRLLIYTDKTVKEIAYDLGFEETGSLFKLFKKYTTKTPQEFKLEFKKS
jgi:AraC-like DNA-binding protein